MAAIDPVLIQGIIATNATVSLTRDGEVLDAGRRVAFSYGTSLTSLAPDDRIGAFGPVERAEVIDAATSTWQRDDLLTIQAFDNHPVLPEITTYLVTAARRFPGSVPLIVLSLTGTVTTAPAI